MRKAKSNVSHWKRHLVVLNFGQPFLQNKDQHKLSFVEFNPRKKIFGLAQGAAILRIFYPQWPGMAWGLTYNSIANNVIEEHLSILL
jgi:hypothetical protein